MNALYSVKSLVFNIPFLPITWARNRPECPTHILSTQSSSDEYPLWKNVQAILTFWCNSGCIGCDQFVTSWWHYQCEITVHCSCRIIALFVDDWLARVVILR